MAFVFVLALLLDSACAAACIPAELEAPAEDCSAGHHGAESSERGCDLHGHLKPVVKDRGFAAVSTEDPSASVESPKSTSSIDFVLDASPARDVVFHVPPILQRISILRI
ncbi:MAG TPA: hypothetical protein VJH87_18880 [Vicinamibacteria bacterium]|nr:hypothetical protein [Vicinamibacteria bacterium]